MFVRQGQIILLDESGNRTDLASPSSAGSSATTPDEGSAVRARSRLNRFALLYFYYLSILFKYYIYLNMQKLYFMFYIFLYKSNNFCLKYFILFMKIKRSPKTSSIT